MYSLYLHIPFCRHRCSYCDFNTYAGLEAWIEPYVHALGTEIRQIAAAQPGLPVHTVFFGGGTPSLLPIPLLEQLIRALHETFDLAPDAEITLEANPGTVDKTYLHDLHALGVNRLSFGMQSARPDELRLLERQHDPPDVIRCVTWARQAGFENINLDLIFGLPHQTLAHWQTSVEAALALEPMHLALYALTLEHGTPLAHWVGHGWMAAPDPDLAAEMYEWAAERLSTAGYAQYEISNWAQPGFECRHNRQYWRNLPYLGLGAGAHGFAQGFRTANVRAPQAYAKRAANAQPLPFPRTFATVTLTPIDRETEIQETLMMGLRLTEEGVSDAAFRARFGEGLQERYSETIAHLGRLGLVEWTPDARLRLTPRGRLLGNRVFMEFLK